jgi:hypothetical protein
MENKTWIGSSLSMTNPVAAGGAQDVGARRGERHLLRRRRRLSGLPGIDPCDLLITDVKIAGKRRNRTARGGESEGSLASCTCRDRYRRRAHGRQGPETGGRRFHRETTRPGGVSQDVQSLLGQNHRRRPATTTP